MNSIFEIFLTLFMSIWEAIDGLLSPLISLIGEYTPKIIGFVTQILSFLIDGLFLLLDGIVDFFNFDWLKKGWKNLFGGGGSSGGGGFGVR